MMQWPKPNELVGACPLKNFKFKTKDDKDQWVQLHTRLLGKFFSGTQLYKSRGTKAPKWFINLNLFGADGANRDGHRGCPIGADSNGVGFLAASAAHCTRTVGVDALRLSDGAVGIGGACAMYRISGLTSNPA